MPRYLENEEKELLTEENVNHEKDDVKNL